MNTFKFLSFILLLVIIIEATLLIQQNKSIAINDFKITEKQFNEISGKMEGAERFYICDINKNACIRIEGLK